TSNRFHSFYPGMLVLENNCAENLISANHFLRDREPWPPMQAYDNGLDDAYGLLHINGSNNSVIANHISETIDVQYLKPQGIKPVIIRLVSGKGNYIANNHIVATTETSAAQAQPSEEDACFAAQVSALLTTARLKELDAVAVQVEKESAQNTILDSGSDAQVVIDRARNAFRATPVAGN
ncbi:TPA: right-handed parallel beta-helix repeat-containing protein, partial [Klebsiella michiganensis]|nr:right-handed parallel beta-helix repeat-containing protein [Klebsiella michiganensis]